jgi:hypothetical protein
VLDSGFEVDAFYLTSLRPLASKLLLNVESDDYGIVEQRDCGCPFGELGFHRHLRRIRSFGKLTGEGVTLVGTEMVRILEDVLPARFDGSPQDFQLVEEEDDATGFTRLTLVVHPRLQIARHEEVIEAMLEALAESSISADLARTFWQQADTFRVSRREPMWTDRGKMPSILRAGMHAPGRRTEDGQGPAPRPAAGRAGEQR